MKILAFDTTARVITGCLCEDEKLTASFFMETKAAKTTEALLPQISVMMRSAGVTVADLGLIAVSAGPGSFTGVRVGCAAAKGLAFGKDVPCAGVSSLEAMAYNLRDRNGIVMASMDARRSQLYHALFEIKDGSVTRLTGDAASSAKDAADAAAGTGATGVICVGDGAEIAAEALAEKGIGVSFPAYPLLRQYAYGVALCGYRMMLDGKTVKADELLPVYLRGFGDGQ